MMKKWLLFVASTYLFASSVTLYPDMAFVQEERQVHHGMLSPLPKGIVEDSIYLGCDVKSFAFDPGGLDFKKILHVGDEVEFFHKKEKLHGRILSLEPLIIKADRLYFDLSFKDLLLKDLPPGYQLQPSLRLFGQIKRCEISYLLSGVGFKTRYVMSVDKKLHLQGFFDITNESGREYRDTKIRFLTGKPNRVNQVFLRTSLAKSASKLEVPKRVKGNFVYELPGKRTLKRGRESIIFVNEEIPYREELVRECNDLLYNFGTRWYKFDRRLIFKAPRPLPSGLARVYSKGLFLSEDSIPDRAAKEQVVLRLGEDFEVRMKKRLKEYTNTKSFYKSVVEYTFINPKSKTVELKVIEHIPTTSLQYACKGMECEKKDARSLLIRITLPPHSSKKGLANFQYFK